MRAVEAYRAGVAPYLVVSGGQAWHGVLEATAYRQALLQQGIAEEFIFVEPQSHTTLENARYTKLLFEQRGWQHAAVVTCDWHLARAQHCFTRAGLSSVGLGPPAPGMSRFRRLAMGVRERGALVLDLIGATRP
jgi:uncharacterized SAM-binding protein YcdF (DUF218 family)